MLYEFNEKGVLIKVYKICLIIPYFGMFKNYFQLFLNSCENNSTIDWLIFTDSNQEYYFPKNVNKISIEFDELKDIVQQNFDFKICLDTPYKLCDYKPAYGEIFKKYLKNYDFWGYCDCDLIFGDIRRFINDEILERYDKLFTRGHLSLYRNNDKTNSFYRTQNKIDYKTIYTSNKIYAFDEWPGVSSIWDEYNNAYYDDLCMDDIRVGFDGFHPTKEISGILSPYHKYNTNQVKQYKKMKNIYYEMVDGHLYRKWFYNKNIFSEEIIYVHFQKRTMKIEISDCFCQKYIIVNNTFINSKHIAITDVINDTFKNKILRLKVSLYSIKIFFNNLFKR